MSDDCNKCLTLGISFSLLPALSLDGILHLQVFEGSVTGGGFKDFLAGLLQFMNPYPAPNLVLIMDNCATHKVAGVREMITDL